MPIFPHPFLNENCFEPKTNIITIDGIDKSKLYGI